MCCLLLLEPLDYQCIEAPGTLHTRNKETPQRKKHDNPKSACFGNRIELNYAPQRASLSSYHSNVWSAKDKALPSSPRTRHGHETYKKGHGSGPVGLSVPSSPFCISFVFPRFITLTLILSALLYPAFHTIVFFIHHSSYFEQNIHSSANRTELRNPDTKCRSKP